MAQLTDAVVALSTEARDRVSFKHFLSRQAIAFGNRLDKEFVQRRQVREHHTATTVDALRQAQGRVADPTQ